MRIITTWTWTLKWSLHAVHVPRLFFDFLLLHMRARWFGDVETTPHEWHHHLNIYVVEKTVFVWVPNLLTELRFGPSNIKAVNLEQPQGGQSHICHLSNNGIGVKFDRSSAVCVDIAIFCQVGHCTIFLQPQPQVSQTPSPRLSGPSYLSLLSLRTQFFIPLNEFGVGTSTCADVKILI